MNKSNKIFIVGAGYVGIANGVMLASNNLVHFIDIDVEKISQLNHGVSPLKENDLVRYCSLYKDNISASETLEDIEDGSYVILALPTNYSEEKESFDTQVLKDIAGKILKNNSNCILIIKSTIPVGFTEKLNKQLNTNNIFFSPEFLREGRSYFDATNPERIIVSPTKPESKNIINLFLSSVVSCNPSNCLVMSSSEAEAVKLFSNTYLAMRVSYFNEVDSYCLDRNFDTKNILDGICKDSRIGDNYNNPSFGYGGYCFPKDTKQALSTVGNVPQKLFKGIVDSNETRLNFLAKCILDIKKKPIGIYRLNMKSGSDNIRHSSTFMLMEKLLSELDEILIYEPLCDAKTFQNKKVILINSLSEFKERSKLIIANRKSIELDDFSGEIFSRDIYNEN